MSDGMSEARKGTYFKDRSKQNKPVIIWFTGLPQSGKTTLGKELVKTLNYEGFKSFLLDGDVLRAGLNKDLDFRTESRIENIRRAAELVKIVYSLNYNIFCAFLTPTEEMRDLVRSIIPEVKFIFVDTPLEVCESRDTKGMYAKARNGEIDNFTGVSAPFETMHNAWMSINTNERKLEENVQIILDKIKTI